MSEPAFCPVCDHPHLDYADESCVSCGCDFAFILTWDDDMKRRLVEALAPSAVNAALDKVAAAARAFDGTYVDCGGGYGFRDDDLIDRSDVLLAIEAARPKP